MTTDGAYSVTSCYWDKESSGNATDAAGSGVTGVDTTAEMQTLTTFTDWDFADILFDGTCYYPNPDNPSIDGTWYILTGDYPRLMWEEIEVPDVYNTEQSLAEQSIKCSGFIAGGVSEEHSDVVSAGNIMLQDPDPGVLASYGDAVDITTSLGPSSSMITIQPGDIIVVTGSRDFNFTGGPDTSATVIINGHSYIICNRGGRLVWDCEGFYEHTFDGVEGEYTTFYSGNQRIKVVFLGNGLGFSILFVDSLDVTGVGERLLFPRLKITGRRLTDSGVNRWYDHFLSTSSPEKVNSTFVGYGEVPVFLSPIIIAFDCDYPLENYSSYADKEFYEDSRGPDVRGGEIDVFEEKALIRYTFAGRGPYESSRLYTGRFTFRGGIVDNIISLRAKIFYYGKKSQDAVFRFVVKR